MTTVILDVEEKSLQSDRKYSKIVERCLRLLGRHPNFFISLEDSINHALWVLLTRENRDEMPIGKFIVKKSPHPLEHWRADMHFNVLC